MKRSFYVKALRDDAVKRWYSESDIFGLHIETDTLDEFEVLINEFAAELIVANHMTAEDLALTSIKDLLPTVIWQRPTEERTAA